MQYQVVRVSFKEIKSINPLGKVPVIEHCGEIYTESLAIMEHLVSLTTRADLVPTNSNQIYPFRHFIYYLLSEVESYLWLAEQASGLKAFYSWPEGTYAQAMLRVTNNLETIYSKIVNADYMVANFTIADIYAYHVLTWAQSHGVKLPESTLQYLAKLEQRPLFPIAMKN